MTSAFDELLRKTEGELTARRTAELDQELARSPELQAEQRRVEELLAALAQPGPGLDTIDLREGLWARPVPEQRRSRTPLALAGGLALALAAALALVVGLPREDESGFRARGGGAAAAAGIEAFVLREGQVNALGSTLRPDDALGFAYRNPPGSPWRALMIYAVDARGRTFWFYPEWREGQAPPSAVAIEQAEGRVELPMAVRHSLEPGPLDLHALFLVEPLSVEDVEQGRVPRDGVADSVTRLEVVP